MCMYHHEMNGQENLQTGQYVHVHAHSSITPPTKDFVIVENLERLVNKWQPGAELAKV